MTQFEKVQWPNRHRFLINSLTACAGSLLPRFCVLLFAALMSLPPTVVFAQQPSQTGAPAQSMRRFRQSHAHLADQHGGFSSRLYRENKLPFFVPMGVDIPVAVSAFPDEIFQCPRNWAEQAYPKLIRYNKLAKGGHFAAWEQPQLITEEVRTGFRSLR